MKKLLCFVVFLVLVYGPVWAATLYVSVGGKDNNPGTRALPLATVAGARNKIRSMTPAERNAGPIYVMIDAGTYDLTEPIVFSPEDSGTERSPVIYKAATSVKPVISGAAKLPAFEKVSDTLWKIALTHPESFEQFYVNGQRTLRAQSPVAGEFYHVLNMTETIITDTKTKRWPERSEQRIQLEGKALAWAKKLSDTERKDVIFTFYLAWDIVRRKMTGFSLEDSTVTLIGEGARPWNKINPKTTFIVDNSKSFLDTPGEWYLENSTTLFYVPKAGETPENSTALIPLHEQLLAFAGTAGKKVQYLFFENISFQYTSNTMPPEGYGPEQASAGISAAIMADGADHISFTGCEIAHTANYGIWFRSGSTYNTIQQCSLTDLGAGGIKVGNTVVPENDEELTHHTVIDNNIITSGGHVYPTGVGVLIFHSGDNTVTHNDISNLKYSGISAGWIWGYAASYAKNNNISFNHIHHLGWGVLSDMGGVYLLGPAPGTVVNNNLIHHIYSYDYGGWGLYTDEGSTGVIMENNLVYACKSSAFHQHYGKENIIRNNIFASQVKAQLEATRVEEHLSFTFMHNVIYEDEGVLSGKRWTTVKMRSDSNSYWDTRTQDIRFDKLTFAEWHASGKDIHSIIANPKFKNASQRDYHIRNKELITTIGFTPFAYEKAGVYGAPSWKELAKSNADLEKDFDVVSRKNEYAGK